MVDVGDPAPAFTAPLANGDVETFSLTDRLDEAPLVLAFFPGAFTSVCRVEMCEFRDRLSRFEDVDATVYGVSVDTPFALNEFREKLDLGFGLVSDLEQTVVEAYGVTTDFPDLGLTNLARRSVFVIDGDGTVTYRWVSKNPGVEPDYAAVESAVGAD